MKLISKTQILLVTASVAVMLMVIIVIKKDANNKSSKEKSTPVVVHKKNRYVDPPFPKADITYSTYHVPANKDTTIIHFTGTKILISANSFQNQDGQNVKGNIDLLYRELSNAWDIYVSGIPMVYKQDSVEYPFESAGMFDIKGKQNGKSVAIMPGKSIRVEMVSHNPENRFNSYYLDTIRKNWVDLGKSIIKTRKAATRNRTDTRDTILNELKVAEISSPSKPLHVDSAKKLIHLLITNRDKFPELDVFSDLSFEVIKDNNEFKPGKSDMEWHKPKIEESELADHYYLTMEGVGKNKPKKNIRWLVRPAFKGKDYQTAMAIYKEQYIQYKKEVARQEEFKRQFRLQQIADSIKYANQEKEWEAEQRRYQKTQTAIDRIYRTMFVNNFGVYNCDYALRNRRGDFVTPVFVDAEKNSIELRNVTLIDKSLNGVFTYNLYWDKKIWVNRKSEQMIWGLAQDTVLYVLKTKNLKDLDFTKADLTIPMERYSDIKKVREVVMAFLNKE